MNSIDKELTQEEIDELLRIVTKTDYNPCQGGHIFQWSSNSTDSTCPSDQYCMCGAFTWAQLQENTGK